MDTVSNTDASASSHFPFWIQWEEKRLIYQDVLGLTSHSSKAKDADAEAEQQKSDEEGPQHSQGGAAARDDPNSWLDFQAFAPVLTWYM